MLVCDCVGLVYLCCVKFLFRFVYVLFVACRCVLCGVLVFAFWCGVCWCVALCVVDVVWCVACGALLFGVCGVEFVLCLWCAPVVLM